MIRVTYRSKATPNKNTACDSIRATDILSTSAIYDSLRELSSKFNDINYRLQRIEHTLRKLSNEKATEEKEYLESLIEDLVACSDEIY